MNRISGGGGCCEESNIGSVAGWVVVCTGNG